MSCVGVVDKMAEDAANTNDSKTIYGKNQDVQDITKTAGG